MSTYRADPTALRSLATDLDREVEDLTLLRAAHTMVVSRGRHDVASRVASIVGDIERWVADWSPSLRQRADLLEHDAFYRSPHRATMTTPTLRQGQVDAFRQPSSLVLEALAAGGGASRQAFLAGRTMGELGRLAQVVPGIVADEPTMPLPIRFTANRRKMEFTRANLSRQLQEISDRTPLPVASTQQQVNRLMDELALLDEFLAPGRNYLYFDWERQHVAEYHGDVDAARVMMVSPGMSNSMFSMASGIAEWGQLGVKYDPTGGDLAFVTILIYDSPELGQALSPRAANEGAVSLGTFVWSLPDDRRYVIAGHSYGSIVAAQSLHHAPLDRIDSLLVFGSNGVRADHVSELPIDADKVWAVLIAGDKIRLGINLVGEMKDWWECRTNNLATRHPAVPTLPLPGDPAALDSCDLEFERLHHGINPASDAFGAQFVEIERQSREGSSHSGYFAEYKDADGVVRPDEPLLVLLGLAAGQRPAHRRNGRNVPAERNGSGGTGRQQRPGRSSSESVDRQGGKVVADGE